MKNSELLRKSATYNATMKTMREYQLAYLGGMSFKQNVRKKRPSEDEKLHTDVLSNTSAMPISRYIVDTINDTVFSQPVHRELEFCDAMGNEIEDELDWTELVCYDADLNNQSLDSFMAQVGEMTSVFGHAWVFVDMPLAEEGSNGRPYAALVSPLQVWDWHFATIKGRSIASYIKVCEYEDNQHWIFKCYYLGTTKSPSYWESYRVKKGAHMDEPAEQLGTGTFPLGMSIPGFIAFTRRDPRFIDLGVSDIDSASDVQREIYKLECEAYQAIQFARTIVRVDPGLKVPPAHSGAVFKGPLGSIEAIAIDTQDVNTIIDKQENLLAELEALSGLSGLRQSKQQAQSGLAIIQERAQLHKMAKSKARELEVCEEFIWTYMARFMDVRWAGEVEYGTNYAETDTQLKIAKLQMANQLSGTNPVIKSIIDQSVLELLVDDGAERKQYLDIMRATPMLMANGVEAPMIMIEDEVDTDIESRDLADQTPDAIPQWDKDIVNGGGNAMPGYTGINDVGMTTFTPVADSLIRAATGR